MYACSSTLSAGLSPRSLSTQDEPWKRVLIGRGRREKRDAEEGGNRPDMADALLFMASRDEEVDCEVVWVEEEEEEEEEAEEPLLVSDRSCCRDFSPGSSR